MLRQEFFKHRLQNKFHRIKNDSISNSYDLFWRKQKMANCPCQVHTASRGHDWVVFRRQPDRTPTLYYEQTESESDEEDQIEEDDYFSVDPVEIDEENKEDCTPIVRRIQMFLEQFLLKNKCNNLKTMG